VSAMSWDYLVPYPSDAATAMSDLHAATLAVTEKEARVTFGTVAPTIEDLERWGGVGTPELQSLLPGHGVGRHIVLHTNDQPSHILFWGRTGE
jgi:hypothetical protein